MASLFGQIDLNKIGDFVRQNPEAVKSVTFKDGTVHKMLNVSINESRTPDSFGNDHYLKIYVPKDKVKPNVNYFMANLKSSSTQAQVQQEAPAQKPLPLENVALPSNPEQPAAPAAPAQEPELPF